ncbi:hypothetical protein Goklo_008771 [Gossypium klotzschianum]|nr:hypothetical protein [Gossypium klotzschianum]
MLGFIPDFYLSTSRRALVRFTEWECLAHQGKGSLSGQMLTFPWWVRRSPPVDPLKTFREWQFNYVAMVRLMYVLVGIFFLLMLHISIPSMSSSAENFPEGDGYSEERQFTSKPKPKRHQSIKATLTFPKLIKDFRTP